MLLTIVPAILSLHILAGGALTGGPSTASLLSRSSAIMAAVDASARPPPPLPALAKEWGCDEETWAAVTNKRNLMSICKKGDKEHFQKRLASIKELMANPAPPAASAPAKVARGKAQRKERPLRKEGPYKLSGGLPNALDEEAITAKVNARAEAKVAKDYTLADAIREELATQGVRIQDDTRTWSYKNPAADRPNA